eukprot:5670707-Amphidinium_carterae.2
MFVRNKIYLMCYFSGGGGGRVCRVQDTQSENQSSFAPARPQQHATKEQVYHMLILANLCEWHVLIRVPRSSLSMLTLISMARSTWFSSHKHRSSLREMKG